MKIDKESQNKKKLNENRLVSFFPNKRSVLVNRSYFSLP